jgi:hypothetical protein
MLLTLVCATVGLIEKGAAGGFEASYDRRPLRMRLYFNRDQRLVRWKPW